MSHTRHSIIVYHKNACSFHFLPRKSKKPPLSRELQLVDISKLGLNSKIKKFSYLSFAEMAILPLRGENRFIQSKVPLSRELTRFRAYMNVSASWSAG